MTLHQTVHNLLLDLEEPVSEFKKVTDFLKGIRNSALHTGKSIVQECRQNISTIVQNMEAQSKSKCSLCPHPWTVAVRTDHLLIASRVERIPMSSSDPCLSMTRSMCPNVLRRGQGQEERQAQGSQQGQKEAFQSKVGP